MKKYSLLILFFVIFILPTACKHGSPIPSPSVTPQPTLTPVPTPLGGGSGKLLYVSNQDGNNNIYMLNLVYMEITQLTDHPEEDTNPSWSPDGTKIAFESARDGNYEIYIMDINTSKVQRVTFNNQNDTDPFWLPSGNQLAFHTYRPEDEFEGYYSIQIDGTDEKILFNIKNDSYISLVYDIEWSEKTQKYGLVMYFKDHVGLFISNKDGSEIVEVHNYKEDSFPGYYQQYLSWSPDGSKIAFSKGRSGSYNEVYYINLFSEEVIYIYTGSYQDYDPAWSPDGNWIAFSSLGKDTFNRDIYFYNIETEEMINITNSPASDILPAWQP